MENIDVTKLSVTMKYRGYHQKYIAQVKELPFITVHGNSTEEVNSKLEKQLKTFFRTFPEKFHEIFDNFGEKADTNDISETELKEQMTEENWITEKKEISIPVTN